MTDVTQPTAAQEQRAKWDQLLTDIELKQEQLRQLRVFEPWRVAFAGMGAGAALLTAGAALGAVLAHMLGGS